MRQRAKGLDNLVIKPQTVIFSVQAVPGSNLASAEVLHRIALDVIAGGATALRLASAEVISEVRKSTRTTILGISKIERPGFKARITQSCEEIRKLAAAGAQIVGIDSTLRAHPEPLIDLYSCARENDLEVFADIDNLQSAHAAIELGADYIATTMAGYTDTRLVTEGPDFELLSQVVELGKPSVLEGRVRGAADVTRAYEMGAYAVVVGRSVTSPRDITKTLLRELVSQ